MKIIYFDTSTYNKIVELPEYKSMIKKTIQSGIFEILFSLLNFEEFLHTRDVAQRTRLFKLAHFICSDKIFLCHSELLRKELKAFLDKISIDRKDLCCTGSNLFQRAIDGTFLEDIPSELFQEMKNKKRDYYRFEKESKKKLADSWNIYHDVKFEEFYKKTLQNSQGKAILKDICDRASKSRIDETDFSKIDLEKMPGLRFLFKYICVSIYNPLPRNEKLKWGNSIDMNHSVFIGHSDVFVTEDDDFLKIIRLFNEPQTECLSLNDFINKYVQVNK